MDTCRVIIADDHALFRQGLKKLLEGSPGLEVVGEAEDGLDLLRLLEKLTPNIILLDISMPNLRGIEAIQKIKRMHPKIKILVVTMHDDKDLLYRTISAGADGYFLKKEADRKLFSAIEKVCQGRVYIPPELSDKSEGDWEGIFEGFQKSLLTDREKEILNLIAQGRSNKEIGNLLSISVHTVERHRANIMRKLDLHTMADLIHYAIQKKHV